MSRKRSHKEKSCTGKIRHGSQRQARDHARELQVTGEPWVMAYRCRYCGGWHVGHAPEKLRQKLKKRVARAHGHNV